MGTEKAEDSSTGMNQDIEKIIKHEDDDRVCVLIVDDKLEKQTALFSIVSRMSLDAVVVDSGKEALRQLLKRDFAVILLDVRMPGMDGYETAMMIRSRPRSEHTPIIFVTAEAMSDEEKIKGYALGAVDWMLSPIVPEVLQAKIQVFADLFRLNRLTQLQAEELKEHNKRLRQEIASIAQIQISGNGHSITKPLVDSHPSIFQQWVDRYANLLEHAVRRQNYQVDYDVSGKLSDLALEMAQIQADPHDVVLLHNNVLQKYFETLDPRAVQIYLDEARLMVLELMGFLAIWYKSKVPKASTTKKKKS